MQSHQNAFDCRHAATAEQAASSLRHEAFFANLHNVAAEVEELVERTLAPGTLGQCGHVAAKLEHFCQRWIKSFAINADVNLFLSSAGSLIEMDQVFLKSFLQYLCCRDDDLPSLALATVKSCLCIAILVIEKQVGCAVPHHIREELQVHLSEQLSAKYSLQGACEKNKATINDTYNLLQHGAFQGTFQFKNSRDWHQFCATIAILLLTAACSGKITVSNRHKDKNKSVRYKDLSFRLHNKDGRRTLFLDPKIRNLKGAQLDNNKVCVQTLYQESGLLIVANAAVLVFLLAVQDGAFKAIKGAADLELLPEHAF